jgi:hypothetical protein
MHVLACFSCAYAFLFLLSDVCLLFLSDACLLFLSDVCLLFLCCVCDARFISCVDGCFLIFVMSKLVLFCYADSRLRFVLACFPCLMLVLACFLFADARLLVLHILACISCVNSCLVF